jgi:peptidoglycan hydrolase-like amidase
VSHTDDYRIRAGTEEVGILLLGTSATLSRKDGRFVFSSSDLSFATSTYLRLEPVHDEHAIFELPSITRHLRGKGTVKFNTYRGALEYRMTKKGDALYLINDVPIEDYVAGVAETSPTAPVEYMKAMAVAARTYAYVTAATTKHDRQYFDVLASTADQLYLGYESERTMARVTEATVATHGMMVTYGGVPVVTPYFAHSNGHTRSWQSVWGGSSHPWLVAVTTTYDAARFKKRSGHGVGMSGYDAPTRAKSEAIDYIALLKYYYTGVDVEQIYE